MMLLPLLSLTPCLRHADAVDDTPYTPAALMP